MSLDSRTPVLHGMRDEALVRKDRYEQFCERVYVPLYSKPWWMDAVCGSENWDVWLYEEGGHIAAAMPDDLEERKYGLYITKPPLTQNNGIVFDHPVGAGIVARAKFEEKVVRAAMAHVDSLGLAVYEQQFPTSYITWLPHSWCGCAALPRYTYVIKDTSDLDSVWQGMSSSYRKNVKKGRRNLASVGELDRERFWIEHAKVFERQNLPVPFSRTMWTRLFDAAYAAQSGRALCAVTGDGQVASVLFLVWDERRMYHLLGGTMPGFSGLETYNALTWTGIELAHEKGLAYDFEGSMIERIAKSFREFGGTPELYFRIRKVYSPEVVRMEAEQQVSRLEVS